MIDPIASALDAIAAHFHGLQHPEEAWTLTARRGWPEHEVALDFTAGPLLTVSRGAAPRADRCTPRAVHTEDVPQTADALVTYRVGFLYLEGQLDLWAPYRAVRDDFAALLETRAAASLPAVSSLRLTSTGYHGRPLTVDLTPLGAEDDRGAATVGEWRQTWRAGVVTDLVVQVTHPRQIAAAIAELGVDLT